MRALNFSGSCGRVRPAKLTNHNARTNLEIQHLNIEDIYFIHFLKIVRK